MTEDVPPATYKEGVQITLEDRSDKKSLAKPGRFKVFREAGGWFVCRTDRDLRWGPSVYLPSHSDEVEFDGIVEVLQVSEEEHSEICLIRSRHERGNK